MADIRCPKCKTVNPAGARVCTKCGQVLAEESTGWLDSLRGGNDSAAWDEAESSARPEETIQPDGEIPDWLQRIRQRNQEEQEQTQKPSPAREPGEELPDWLRDIQSGSSGSETSAESGGEEDWLQNLRGPEIPFVDQIQAAPEAPYTGSQAGEKEEDASDWMKGLDSWKSEADQQAAETPAVPSMDWDRSGGSEAPGQAAGSEEDDQDWLGKLSQFGGSQPAAAEPDSDWLAGLQSSGEPAAEQPTPDASASDEDWLASLQAATGAEPEPAAEQPAPVAAQSDMDWLASLQAETGTEPEPAAEQPEQAAPQSDMDWLASLQAETGTEPEPAAEQPEQAAPQSDMDWLASLQAATGAEPEPAAEEAVPAAAEFDWMSGLPSDGQAGKTIPAASAGVEAPFDQTSFEAAGEAAQPAAELPDWLSNLPAQEAVPAESPSAGVPADEYASETGESVPDWLKNFTPEETPAQPAGAVTPISEEPQEESFSWESFGIPAETTPSTAEESGEALPFAGANLPEWLDKSGEGEPRLPYDHELIPPAEPAGEEAENVPFVAAALPNWLDESGETEPAAQAAGELPPEGGEQPLEAAELPSWLQSMRPIEMVAPKSVSAEEKRVEKAGPLAGLTGVLPTEDLVGQYIRPPLYSVKLRVSEKQRVHASLIENLISEESQAQPIPAERSEAPQRVLRFLVAIVLILAILLPLLNFLPTFPEAGMLPQELVDFGQILNDPAAIPSDSAILLAVEYEPGLSGELQTASEAVIRVLAERGVRLAVISTSPTGPVLAESLLEQAGFDAARVVNLGYLAGDSTGLQSFGLSPMRAAPATLQGDPAAWNDGVLAGVSSLKDFAAVIVLTDDPDKGRNWVEQVQGVLVDTPMLMVSSAQASPLLLPYYNSGQVKGIISGISGAASFESLIDSSGTATLLRGSYQYGMLLAALLILAGGLVTGIITSITRGKAEKEA